MRFVVAVSWRSRRCLPLTATLAQVLLPGEREANVVAIPGVVAAGAKWQIVWADFKTADGIGGTSDGGVIFAQEQSDSVKRLDPSGKEWTLIPFSHGIGSVSLDNQGRLFGVERTVHRAAELGAAGLQRAAADRATPARAQGARDELRERRAVRPSERPRRRRQGRRVLHGWRRRLLRRLRRVASWA